MKGKKQTTFNLCIKVQHVKYVLFLCWDKWTQEPVETSSFLICCIYGPPGGWGALSSDVISWCFEPAPRPREEKHVLYRSSSHNTTLHIYLLTLMSTLNLMSLLTSLTLQYTFALWEVCLWGKVNLYLNLQESLKFTFKSGVVCNIGFKWTHTVGAIVSTVLCLV